MEKEILNKILIVGDAGRGKSTLASKISAKLGIQNYSTDDFFYEVKFTKLRDRKESVEKILEIYKNDKWIIEGTTRHLFEHGLDSADKIINLKYKSIPTQWAVLLRRYFQRKNEIEPLGKLLGLMKHALYKKHHWGYRKFKPTPTEIIDPYKHKVITLSSFKEIDEFLESL